MGYTRGCPTLLDRTMIVNLYATTIVIALCGKNAQVWNFPANGTRQSDYLSIYVFRVFMLMLFITYSNKSTSLSHFSTIIIVVLYFSLLSALSSFNFSLSKTSLSSESNPLLPCQCNHSPRHKFAAMRASVETTYRRNPRWLTLLRKSREGLAAHRRTSRVLLYNNTFVRACSRARSRAHCCGVNVGAQYESSSIETIGNFRRRISVGSGGSAHGHSLGKLKSRQ